MVTFFVQLYCIFAEKHAERKLKLYKKGHYDLCLMIRQVHTVHC